MGKGGGIQGQWGDKGNKKPLKAKNPRTFRQAKKPSHQTTGFPFQGGGGKRAVFKGYNHQVKGQGTPSGGQSGKGFKVQKGQGSQGKKGKKNPSEGGKSADQNHWCPKVVKCLR